MSIPVTTSSKFKGLWVEETSMINGRLLLAGLVLAPFPLYVGNRVRPAVLRALGFSIGKGTVMWGLPTFTGQTGLHRMLTIGRECWINMGVLINLGAQVVIEDQVAIGHQVMILTETHRVAGPARRAGEVKAFPVTIGSGAWLGARSLILPGVRVGAGAVVAAGAVVTKDVPPNTLVGGVPAVVLRELDGGQ